MMRIISPRGKLVRVGEVIPCCEIRFHFNGEDKRLLEEQKGINSKPTALQIRYNNTGIDTFCDPIYGMFVGNLKPEQVKEIVVMSFPIVDMWVYIMPMIFTRVGQVIHLIHLF